MEQTITIITNIETKPRPRASFYGGHSHIYTPKTALTYERYIASEYQRLGGKYYGNTPLQIKISFYFKTPKSTPKYKLDGLKIYENTGNYEFETPCTIHKDLDNLAKSVLDALNTVAYDDDKQITGLHLEKHWTTQQEQIVIFILEETHYLQDKELKEEVKKWKQN